MRTSLYDYCAEHGLKDAIENAPLTPQTVPRGSKRSMWWKCERGHEWQAMIYTRTDGSGCPYCAGKKTWPGENDLASQRPDLAAQWHPEKNRDRTPADVLLGSHYKAWWLCEKGHAWRAEVKSRVSGCGPFS